jgi:hypothetical protein
MATPAIETQKLQNGDREIPLLIVPQSAEPALLSGALKLQGFGKVIFFFGGADQLDAKLKDALEELLISSFIPAALAAGAVVIDGGTKSGVMELMGCAMAANDYPLSLIGVAPELTVTYPGASNKAGAELDLNHTQLILVRGAATWGSETKTLFKVAAAVLNDKAAGLQPETGGKIVAVLVSGGAVSATEVLAAVRAGISIVVVSGTGGFADQLAAARAQNTDPSDPVIAEIIRDGDLGFYSLSDNPEVFRLSIGRKLTTDKVLLSAWQEFSEFDCNAGIQQSLHKNYQRWILCLGVLAAGLGIFYNEWYPKMERSKYSWDQWFFYGLLILIPIALGTVIAASNKFKNGMKWIFFRAGAEAIKREIYTYRTRTGPYQHQPASLLTERVSQITGKAMSTDINHTYIRPYDRKNGFPPYMTGDVGQDDGFSRLGPESYINFRLKSQIAFFDGKIKTMNGNLSFYNWAIYIITGTGALLAVAEQQVWIALTSAVIAAIGNWLGYQQWDATLSKYNQCAYELKTIIGRWNALEPAEQLKQECINDLVAKAEQALQNEYEGWTQQMQQTLSEQAKKQEEEQARKDKNGKGN